MSWRDLLQTEETYILPWVGGRSLTLDTGQTWTIEGRLPEEHGWYTFSTLGRTASVTKASDPDLDVLVGIEKGYLVGDRFIPATARVDPEPKNIVKHSERIFLVDDGLERFAYVSAGRLLREGGPLIFKQEEFPIGSEDAVRNAYEDEKPTAGAVPGVTPALDAAFRMETWQRAEAERIRLELEARLAKEEAARELAERRRQLAKQLGDGAGRREMALHDFKAAAKAALAVGGAHYLDHRKAQQKKEMVVKFRMLGRRRFECTCHAETLQIIDSGICLIDHVTNEKGDTRFTLESLPTVIIQAEREGRLVVFRHVD